MISRGAVFKGDTPEFSVVIEDIDDMAWKESYNLSLDDWKTYVEEHKADGWRPDHFCYYGTDNKRLFGAILVKDPNRSDWDVSWSLTAADYEKELSARKAQGFRPLTAIGHEDNAGGQRFSAIWIRYRTVVAKEVRAPDLKNVKPICDDTFTDAKSGFPRSLNDDGGESGWNLWNRLPKTPPTLRRLPRLSVAQDAFRWV